MVIDHIGEFVPNAPIILRWIGRSSAPIFLFCCVWSFEYTHSKKKYLLRMYIASIVMAFIQSTYDIPNNFFRTLFSICLLLYLFEICRTKEKHYYYVTAYVLWQIITILIPILLGNADYDVNSGLIIYIIPALLGNLFNLEGGIIYVLLGIIFYLYKRNNWKLVISFLLFDSLLFFLMTTSIIGMSLGLIRFKGFHILYEVLDYMLWLLGIGQMDVGGNPFLENFQWMMIFSLPFLLCYNHKQGKKQKYFFYFFYPLHIIVLYNLFLI